jgi:hypothetical protein
MCSPAHPVPSTNRIVLLFLSHIFGSCVDKQVEKSTELIDDDDCHLIWNVKDDDYDISNRL